MRSAFPIPVLLNKPFYTVLEIVFSICLYETESAVSLLCLQSLSSCSQIIL